MNPVSIDVKDKMVSATIGVFGAVTGWGIFIAGEPPELLTTITIYDTPSAPPGYYMNLAKKPWRQEEFQVRVRGISYVSVHVKALAIQQAIVAWDRFTVGTVDYKGFVLVGDIFPLGKTEKDLYLWVGNYECRRQEQNA